MLLKVCKIRRSVSGFIVMITWDRQDKFDVLAPALVKAILEFTGGAMLVSEIAQRQHPDRNFAPVRLGDFLTQQISRLLLPIPVCRPSFRITQLAFGNVSCRQKNANRFVAWFGPNGQRA